MKKKHLLIFLLLVSMATSLSSCYYGRYHPYHAGYYHHGYYR